MKRIALIVLLISFLFGVGAGLAVDGYDLSWNVLSSGGGPLEDGGYSLNGTLGQAAVGVRTASDYQLCAGYWCQAMGEPFFQVYLPLSSR